jgi:hypothetical protein
MNGAERGSVEMKLKDPSIIGWCKDVLLIAGKKEENDIYRDYCMTFVYNDKEFSPIYKLGDNIEKVKIYEKSECVFYVIGNLVYCKKINMLSEKESKRFDIQEAKAPLQDFCVGDNTIYVVDAAFHKLIKRMEGDYQEDSDEFDALRSNSEEITREGSDTESCTNDNLITLEPYTKDDEAIVVYLPNKENKFEKAICSTHLELTEYLRSGEGTSTPDSIMAIYTRPRVINPSGYGSKPSGRIVVKLPVNNVYITMGSMERIMGGGGNKIWYALPLFGGKRRRIGNLKGLFGRSMNHGQVPGFQVYKVYTKEEIRSGVVVEEDNGDYPIYEVENTKSLYDIIGEENINDIFVKGLIDAMTKGK